MSGVPLPRAETVLVNVATSSGRGKLYADAYSVAPAGIFVPADSPIRDPAHLAGVPISVGYQPGSHYSTIQALESLNRQRMWEGLDLAVHPRRSSMMRYAPWAMALALFPVAAAGSAHAGRSHTNVAVVATFGHPPFFSPFFHPFHPVFFRSTVFVGAPVFAPPPVVLYQPPVYYAPPVYVYPPPAAAGAPSGGTSYGAEDCRQYETTITIDGKPQTLVDTVCKGPDGNWHRAQAATK